MGDILNAKKAILTDIANGERNFLGDYWDKKTNILDAVAIINDLECEIERLENEITNLKKKD